MLVLSGADSKAPQSERHEPMQTYHFFVRSVLLSQNSTALTLEPVTWLRESETETIEIDGKTVPRLEECDPGDEGADPDHSGGKMTELRVETEGTGWLPGDYVTLTVAPSR
jgi:hypothetical protein